MVMPMPRVVEEKFKQLFADDGPEGLRALAARPVVEEPDVIVDDDDVDDVDDEDEDDLDEDDDAGDGTDAGDRDDPDEGGDDEDPEDEP